MANVYLHVVNNNNYKNYDCEYMCVYVGVWIHVCVLSCEKYTKIDT